MVTEERMQTLFAQANPIPDASSIELDPKETAAGLKTIRDRSGTMTRLASAKQESDPRKLGMRAAIVGAAAVAVIAVAGIFVAQTGGNDVAASESFVGVWESNDGVYTQFNQDGTYAAAWLLDEVSEGTFETGTWTFDGAEFVWITNVGNCETGDTGRYTVEFVELDVAQWNVVLDPCLDRLSDLLGGPMQRLSQ